MKDEELICCAYPRKCGKSGIALNELLRDIADLEKERDYWHNLCRSYEQTIVKMAEAIKNKGEHT